MIALTYDGQVIMYTFDGIKSFLDKDVCEIFYNGKMVVQRCNDGGIKIYNGKMIIHLCNYGGIKIYKNESSISVKLC